MNHPKQKIPPVHRATVKPQATDKKTLRWMRITLQGVGGEKKKKGRLAAKERCNQGKRYG